MSDRLGQVEAKLASANKRIAELETKYSALLEDLKALRAELFNPRPVDKGYVSQFDRWPGANPDDERLRNSGR